MPSLPRGVADTRQLNATAFINDAVLGSDRPKRCDVLHSLGDAAKSIADRASTKPSGCVARRVEMVHTRFLFSGLALPPLS